MNNQNSPKVTETSFTPIVSKNMKPDNATNQMNQITQ